MPGAAILPVYQALKDSSIKHVLVRHEEGGTHAAEGYTRATNDRIGASVHWMGIAAATAISAVAQGRMAPQLRQSRRGGKKGEHGTFSVRSLPGAPSSGIC